MNIQRKGLLFAGAAAVVSIMLPAAAAHAEDTKPSVLDAVIVTAQKRAEDTSKIPLAVSAYSAASLEAAGIADINDLQRLSPGLVIVPLNGSQFQVFLRGGGTSLGNMGAEAGVIVSQDGIPFAQSQLFNADMLDIGRVEVLRGPQGTISGRNSTGGAINVYSALPTKNFEGNIAGTLGNFNDRKVSAVISGPLAGDALLGRFAVSYDKSDGWLRNTLLGQNIADKDMLHARASFVAQLSPELKATLVVDGVSDRSSPQSAYLYGRARPDKPSAAEYYNATELNPGNLTFQDDFRRKYKRDQTTVSLVVDWSLGKGADLKSVTGYVDGNIVNESGEGLSTFVDSFPLFEYHTKQFTQELTLTADLTNRIDLVAGALYLHSRTSEPIEYDAPSVGLVPGFLVGFPVQTLNSYAGYAQVRWQASDRLRFSAGLRYTRDEKQYDQVSPLSFLTGGGRAAWDGLTPRFAVDFQLSDNTLLFADVAKGFMGGGFNTYSIPVNVFNPETVWNTEAGVKGRYFDRKLRLAVTAFSANYKSVQETLFGTGYAPSVLNAASATANGLEGEVEALIGPNFRIEVSATYLDGTYGALHSFDPVYPELGLRDLTGNRMSNAAKFQASISAEYSHPLSDGLNFKIRGNYAWRGQVFTSFYNTTESSIPSYGLLNLSAALDFSRIGLEAEIWARNVGDVRYLTTVATSASLLTPSRAVQLGEPRTYGLTISKKF